MTIGDIKNDRLRKAAIVVGFPLIIAFDVVRSYSYYQWYWLEYMYNYVKYFPELVKSAWKGKA